jgi:putative ABC transport system permease protein
MRTLPQDLRLAVRRLLRAPLFTLAVLGTLTVGLGAFAVVYTAVDRVLLAPLPYDNPDDLYFVWREYGWFDLDRGWLSGPDIAELDRAGGPLEAAVGMSRGLTTLAATPDSEPEEIPILISTAELFDVLGVEALLGRTFRAEEAGPGREPVMVLGHNLWRTRFGGDPGIIGSTVQAGATQYTVIGVMPPDFRFQMHSSLGPPQGVDAYITTEQSFAELNPGAGSYAGLIRARPGASLEAVESAVVAVGARIDERDFDNRGLHLYAVQASEDLVSGIRPALMVLGMAGLVLVVVLMVNLAALLLARAGQREREFAISRALGANRMAVARPAFLEGGLLGAFGGLGGALAAVWGTRVLVSLAPPDVPRLETIAVDMRIAMVVVGVGTLVGLIAAAVPAIWATRSRLAAILRNAAVRGGSGGGLRKGMVVVQVALALVLLSAGSLVVRSFDQLVRADPGFRTEGVLTFRVPIPTSVYPELEDAVAMQRVIRDELGALPGVRAVGATNTLPLHPGARPSQTTFEFPGAPGLTGDPDHDAPLTDWMRITPGYLEAMGIRVVAGRGFEESPSEGLEALIDRTLAERFFPGADPIGFRIPAGEDSYSTIVGVVEHARFYDVHQDGRPQLYVSLDAMPLRNLYFTVRADRPPRSIVPDVQSAIRRLDPGLAISEMRPMEDVVSASVAEQRLSATLIGGFAVGALLLAAMGLFGVVAGTVVRRRHEIAVRLALGADHRGVLRLVVGEGARLVLLGIAVGIPGIYLSARAIRGVLIGVSPFDPVTLVSVAAGLVCVGLVACYLPARRAARVDPMVALRAE